MTNELLLTVNLIVCFGGVCLVHLLFGKQGLYMWTVFATIAANIEVLIVIRAFGMEQTLGNVMFASTFLVTDILSELYGKKDAGRAVAIGVTTSVFFIVISQIWLAYTPADTDWAMPYMEAIFSNTPRVMISGFVTYAIANTFDVWAYHKWWDFTEERFHDHKRWLWLRNNGSTMISQAINTILFTWGSFYGVYDHDTLVAIALSTYVIYFLCALLDTPFVYLCRLMHERRRKKIQN